jgi:hypothetical protein
VALVIKDHGPQPPEIGGVVHTLEDTPRDRERIDVNEAVPYRQACQCLDGRVHPVGALRMALDLMLAVAWIPAKGDAHRGIMIEFVTVSGFAWG